MNVRLRAWTTHDRLSFLAIISATPTSADHPAHECFFPHRAPVKPLGRRDLEAGEHCVKRPGGGRVAFGSAGAGNDELLPPPANDAWCCCIGDEMPGNVAG